MAKPKAAPDCGGFKPTTLTKKEFNALVSKGKPAQQTKTPSGKKK